MRRLSLVFVLLLLSLACVPAVVPEVLKEPEPDRGETQACNKGEEHWRSLSPPRRGGILRKQNFEPGHLDVSAPSQHPGAIPQVYGTLVRTRACYFEDMVMVPSLARSWEVSPDGLTWTFRLRDDISWHNRPPVNGRPFTSSDVGWTIEFVKTEGGLRSYWIDIAHLEPDPRTVVLQLKEPQADFLARLGDHQNVIFPREVKEQFGDFKRLAIGTGPYMLKEYKPNQSIVVERNPEWREAGFDGKPLPYIDELHSIVFGDYAAELAALRSGQIEIGPTLRQQDFDALRASHPKYLPHLEQNSAVFGLFMNNGRRPFDNVRVRRAMALAIDPDEVIAANQDAAVHTGFLPTAIKDYAWPPEKAAQRFRPDVERAKQLLAEAGYGSGQLQFLLKTTRSYSQDAELVQKQLERAGVKMDISVEPVSNTRNILTAGSYEAAWGNPATRSFVADRWLGSFLRTGGSENVVGLSDATVDALSVAQAREMDPARRRQIIDGLQDRLYELMPFVPSAIKVNYQLVSCRLRNFPPPSHASNMEELAGAWLDPQVC